MTNIFNFFKSNIEVNNLNNLLNSDYVIFLSDKFFSKYNYYLIKYFKKYNIVYINYKDKDIIIKQLHEHNEDIKKTPKNKYIKKQKLLHFYENIIEPNTLYKKIIFSNEELFLSFKMYGLKKKEYKLRTFCQIAEKLGALTISINDEITKNKFINITSEINVSNQIALGGSSTTNSTYNGNIELKFDYTNQFYNLNLNKFDLLKIIEDEDELFITKEDFESDIDLKFLINARCINLIKKYNTRIIINQVNELERKIIAKANRFNLDIGICDKTEFSNTIIIDIDFINIYENPECIDGLNIYNMKEGFLQLTNIIKIQTNNDTDDIKKYYSKILNFLESHLISIDEKKINIENQCSKNKTFEAYKYILKKQFKKDDRETLVVNFFQNNLTYQQFLNFRDNIIIAPFFFSSNACCITFIDDIINDIGVLTYKLFFISYQYHIILNSQCKIEDNEFDHDTNSQIILDNPVYKDVLNILLGLLIPIFKIKFPLTYNEEYTNQRDEFIKQNDNFLKQREEFKKREEIIKKKEEELKINEYSIKRRESENKKTEELKKVLENNNNFFYNNINDKFKSSYNIASLFNKNNDHNLPKSCNKKSGDKTFNISEKLGEKSQELGEISEESYEIIKKLGEISEESYEISQKLGEISEKSYNTSEKSYNISEESNEKANNMMICYKENSEESCDDEFELLDDEKKNTHKVKSQNLYIFNLDDYDEKDIRNATEFINNYLFGIDLRNNYINYNILITWSEFKKMVLEFKKHVDNLKKDDVVPKNNEKKNSYSFFNFI